MKPLPTATRPLCLLFCAGFTLLSLTACRDEQPISYQIPKEERVVQMPGMPANHPAPGAQMSPPAGNMQVLPGMQEAADAAPDVSFTLPEGWEDAGATGMRKVNLRVNDANGSAEITALTFPGDVGGRLANINRWRGQIGLPAATPESIPEFSSETTISGTPGLYVRMEGGEKSLIGAILPLHDNTWFFKMIGDSHTVLAQEAAMKAFLDSVQLEDAQQ